MLKMRYQLFPPGKDEITTETNTVEMLPEVHDPQWSLNHISLSFVGAGRIKRWTKVRGFKVDSPGVNVIGQSDPYDLLYPSIWFNNVKVSHPKMRNDTIAANHCSVA